jgi:hypothetical protein
MYTSELQNFVLAASRRMFAESSHDIDRGFYPSFEEKGIVGRIVCFK